MLNQSFPEIKDYMVSLVKSRGYKSRIPKDVFKTLLTHSLKQRPLYNIKLQKDFLFKKAAKRLVDI